MTESVDFDHRKAHIRNQPIFSALTDSEIDILADLLIEVYFEPGNVIVKQGDPVDSVFLIVSGTCDVNVTTYKDNKPHLKKLQCWAQKKP